MGTACSMYREEMHTGFWWGNLREGDHLETLHVNWRIILKLSFEKWVGEHGLDRCGSGQGQVAGSCEYGDEYLGSTKCGEFLEWLRTC